MSSQKAMINTLMFYHWDNTLFDNMEIPEELNRQTVVDSILLETSDFPLVISDLETLRYSIELWSKHRVDIWKKLYETTQYEYNPIENYNRYETTHDDLSETGYGMVKGDGAEDKTETTRVKTGSIEKTVTGSYKDTNSGTDTSTQGVSAFNNVGYSDHERTQLQHGLASERTYNRYTETESYHEPDNPYNPTEIETVKTNNLSGQRTDKNFNNNRTIDGHIHGNIGVTTTQQMIQAEREVVMFDVIDQIVTDYKTTFCILIY